MESPGLKRYLNMFDFQDQVFFISPYFSVLMFMLDLFV